MIVVILFCFVAISYRLKGGATETTQSQPSTTHQDLQGQKQQAQYNQQPSPSNHNLFTCF